MVSRTPLDRFSAAFQPLEYFNHNWQLYQKILQNNYMEHWEMYSILREFLIHQVQKPFQLLDLGCGDASITASALMGTSIQSYYGIDLSQAAIALAHDNLSAISCSKLLRIDDFTAFVPQLVRAQQQRFDVILASFSLHHLDLKQKDNLIGQSFQLLNPGGVLLLIDLVRQPAEDRTTYIDRYIESVRHTWTAFTPQEVSSIQAHMTSSDFPETQETLRQLALEHGFSRSECLYRNQLEFWQLLCFYQS